MSWAIDLRAVVCAASIGFAAHRASLCNVRAIEQLASRGDTRLARSLLHAVLWAAWVGGVLSLVFGIAHAPVWLRADTPALVAGGLLFGVGAALNGGCSLSTLTRLADGEAAMLGTLAGFVAGTVAWSLLPAATLPLRPLAFGWDCWGAAGWWPLAAITLWVMGRLHAAWRAQRQPASAQAPDAAPRRPGPARPTLRQWLTQAHYTPEAGAALLGIAAGAPVATQGPWSYRAR